MGLHLKDIDYDKLTIGTEVYSIWGDTKTVIGVVERKSDNNPYSAWIGKLVHIKTEVPSNYCECCNRGSKEITYHYSTINVTQLKYKKYK